MRINSREELLVFLLTWSMMPDGNDINFNATFSEVYNAILADVVVTFIFTMVFYTFYNKPLYKWLVKTYIGGKSE